MEKFDGTVAAKLVEELRKNFSEGKTRSYGWRADQLKSILRMIGEKEKDIVDALYEDLNKPATESFIQEVCSPLPA